MFSKIAKTMSAELLFSLQQPDCIEDSKKSPGLVRFLALCAVFPRTFDGFRGFMVKTAGSPHF